MARRNDSIKTQHIANLASVKMWCGGCHHQQGPARAVSVYARNGTRLKALANNLVGKAGDDIGELFRADLTPDKHRDPKLFQWFASV
jgi:hypothetical protein